MNAISKFLTCAAMALSVVQTAYPQTNDAELERRQAAVGFFSPMAFALGILRHECRQWLAGSDDDVDQVARQWWERNRNEIDVTTWILADFLHQTRATMAADKALAVERSIIQGLANSAISNLRTPFKGQIPTRESCSRAMQQYKSSQLDINQIGSTKGFEKFTEFSESLKRAQADPAFKRPEERLRTFDTQISVVEQPLATLDAIENAKQKRDWQTLVRGFESLASRGDARAAQSLGIYYLNGQYVARNPQLAFAWFYNAWVLGDPEGINAIGVLWRDGSGVAVDRKLALASFAIARQMTFDRRNPSYQRASTNFDRLLPQMSSTEVREAGCMKWENLHQKLKETATSAQAITLLGALKNPAGTLLDSKTIDAPPQGGFGCAG